MITRQPTLQGQYAGFISRAVAWVIDLFIISVTVFTLAWLTRATLQLFHIDIASCSTIPSGLMGLVADFCNLSRFAMAAASVLAAPFYFIFFWVLGGQTIGNFVTGVRVVKQNGQRLGFGTALLRAVGFFISLILFGLGFLWLIIDSRRQGWHDKLASTCVIYAWKAMPDEGFTAWLNKWLRLSSNTPASPSPSEPSLASSRPTSLDT